MKLGSIRRLFFKDYQDVPQGNWFSQLITSLNLFIDPVLTALRNGLTYEDNFACEQKTITLASNVEYQLGVKGLPKEVRIRECEGAMVTGFSWRRIKTDLIGVTVRFDDHNPHSTTLIIYQ